VRGLVLDVDAMHGVSTDIGCTANPVQLEWGHVTRVSITARDIPPTYESELVITLHRPTRRAKVEAKARLAEGASPKPRIRENEEKTIAEPKVKGPRASPRQKGGKRGDGGPERKVVVKKEESGDTIRKPAAIEMQYPIACDCVLPDR